MTPNSRWIVCRQPSRGSQIRVAAIAYRQCVKGRSPDLPGESASPVLKPRYHSPLRATTLTSASLALRSTLSSAAALCSASLALRSPACSASVARRCASTKAAASCAAVSEERRAASNAATILAAHGALPGAPLLGLSLELRHGLVQSGELIANALAAPPRAVQRIDRQCAAVPSSRNDAAAATSCKRPMSARRNSIGRFTGRAPSFRP